MSSTYNQAVEQTITAGEQIHQIVNGTATTEVTVEDGSKVPSIRKALLDNFYFKDPIAWQVGQTENVFNQLRQFTDGSWWYAPSATASNPISMGSTPVGDSLWKIYDFDAIGRLEPRINEALRRSYAEAGYHLVDGSFEAGGTLVNNNDVLLHESSGKGFSGAAGTVAAGTDPSSGGFVDVSDKINPTFPSVSELKATNATVGCLYHTKGYYAAGDRGSADYVAVPSSPTAPDGYGDHLAANGVVLQLVSPPTDLNHGVRLGIFVADDAWHNRNAIQAMLRNTRWSYFELVAKGEYYILGSVHPLRDDIYINHKQGCAIIGRYNDASIPASFTSQSGGMFGFVKYQDPDNGNFNVVSDIYNITYQLDGSVATEYNASHAATHNNNCIGFYRANDSVVRGVGGVNSSDHRGINFDGDAVNCHIDIGYAKGAMDEPLVMKASSSVGNLCTVKVGRILSCPFTGPNAPIAVRVDGGDIDVNIGSFGWDGVTKPQLVGAFNCGMVRVWCDSVNGASQLVRQYDTLDVEAHVTKIANTQYGIVRAGIATGRMRSAKLTGVKSVDSTFAAAYRTDSNQDTFSKLKITDNIFTEAGSAFAYYSNKLTPGLPSRLDVRDNMSPAGMTVVEFNPSTNGITGNLVTPGASSVVINYKSPDWIYGVMSVIVAVSGTNHAITIDLRTRDLTSTQVNYYAGTGALATTKSGSSLTLTCTGCTLQIVTLHN